MMMAQIAVKIAQFSLDQRELHALSHLAKTKSLPCNKAVKLMMVHSFQRPEVKQRGKKEKKRLRTMDIKINTNSVNVHLRRK